MKKKYFLLTLALAVLSSISIYWKSQPAKTPDQPTQPVPCFLLLSDVHLNTFAKTCNYGDDTGMDLWNNLKAKLKSILDGPNAPKFVIYTGDLPAHYDCNTSCYIPPKGRTEHNANIIKILGDLRDLMAEHHIPLLYAPGNNDALSGDYYAFADSMHQTPLDLVPKTLNPYPALNVAQHGTTVPFMDRTFYPKSGYYAVSLRPGLRVIVLNTVDLGKNYSALRGQSQTTIGNIEMAWFANQLKQAKMAGEKVYIAMHIPPGTDAYAFDHQSAEAYMWAHLPEKKNTWLNQFLKLTSKYQLEISGIFYGHTHMDELRRIYDSTGTKITEVAISCPGITPQHYNNPGFKLVYYDSTSYQPTDFETFYTTPASTTWGDESYRFSDIFHAEKGVSIYDCVRKQSLSDLNTEMDSIYTVMHGAAGYNTKPGIEVKPGE